MALVSPEESRSLEELFAFSWLEENHSSFLFSDHEISRYIEDIEATLFVNPDFFEVDDIEDFEEIELENQKKNSKETEPIPLLTLYLRWFDIPSAKNTEESIYILFDMDQTSCNVYSRFFRPAEEFQSTLFKKKLGKNYCDKPVLLMYGYKTAEPFQAFDHQTQLFLFDRVIGRIGRHSRLIAIESDPSDFWYELDSYMKSVGSPDASNVTGRTTYCWRRGGI